MDSLELQSANYSQGLNPAYSLFVCSLKVKYIFFYIFKELFEQEEYMTETEDCLAHKAQDIYCVIFYRKSLSTYLRAWDAIENC